jgi:putative ABC transport system ATP-binding protein
LKKEDAQKQSNKDANAIAQKSLTKIHVSKVKHTAVVCTPFVNSGFMIACKDIAFQYQPDSPILSFPDLACSEKGQLLLLGNSGCGKTTLLHVMCGLLQPQQGSVEVQGQNLGALNGKDLDRFRGESFGVIFQQSHFIQSLSVLENLAVPHFLLGQSFPKSKAHDLLEALGIAHKATEKPRSLSVGEQQRASIARALVHEPSIVLADEPTSALDDDSTAAVISLLEEQCASAGAALIVVTHDQRLKTRYNNRVELNSAIPPAP